MFFAEVDYDGSSYDFMGREYPEDDILELLSEGQGLYYSFASRDGNNLECANGKTYFIRIKWRTVYGTMEKYYKQR